jgi:GTP pyrophosphokinase
VRVNGRLAPLGTRLQDGDSLQLLLDDAATSRPGADWLDHAATPAARIAISRWLAVHPVPADDEQPAALPALRPAKEAAGPRPELPVAVTDLPGATVRLARCCTPVPPDAVTGFVVRGGTVTVHRAECPTTARMAAAGRQPVPVGWRDGTGPRCWRRR